jgi:hypothetical protein
VGLRTLERLERLETAVELNGTRTAEVKDSKHARGPFSIQYGAGVVKFRKVQVKPL